MHPFFFSSGLPPLAATTSTVPSSVATSCPTSVFPPSSPAPLALCCTVAPRCAASHLIGVRWAAARADPEQQGGSLRTACEKILRRRTPPKRKAQRAEGPAQRTEWLQPRPHERPRCVASDRVISARSRLRVSPIYFAISLSSCSRQFYTKRHPAHSAHPRNPWAWPCTSPSDRPPADDG